MQAPESLKKALAQRKIATWVPFLSEQGIIKIGQILRDGMLNGRPRENIIDEIRLVLEQETLPDAPPLHTSVPANRRAAFIVEREMGMIYAMAQHIRQEETCRLTSGLSRVWVQNGNTKEPNDGHTAMHGQIVSPGQPFSNPLTGRHILYPRDPNADISETLDCGCDVVLYKPEYGPLETFIGRPTERNLRAKSAMQYDPVPPRPTEDQIADYRNRVIAILRQEPGLIQADLYKRFKPEEKEKVGYAISALKKNNEVRRERKGRSFALWLKE